MDSLEEIEKEKFKKVKNIFRMLFLLFLIFFDSVPNYPKEGINFIDITPLLQEPSLSSFVLEFFQQKLSSIQFDAILGIESRGFLFGMALAQIMKKPFILVRKVGKLPAETIKEEYSLEYGTATIEIHKDSLKEGQKVIIHDDLLATGGTSQAAANLTKKLNASVAAFIFVIELEELKGKKLLEQTAQVISMNIF